MKPRGNLLIPWDLRSLNPIPGKWSPVSPVTIPWGLTIKIISFRKENEPFAYYVTAPIDLFSSRITCQTSHLSVRVGTFDQRKANT